MTIGRVAHPFGWVSEENKTGGPPLGVGFRGKSGQKIFYPDILKRGGLRMCGGEKSLKTIGFLNQGIQDKERITKERTVR
jgi:hypothetical protein